MRQLPPRRAGQLRPATLLGVAQLQGGQGRHHLFVQMLAGDQLPVVELNRHRSG
jgi:hypothetical protein